MSRILHYRLFITIAATTIALAGIGVLIGWIIGADELKSIIPGYATMKVNSALCFTCIGLSLLCNLSGNHVLPFIGRLLAGIVLIVGFVSLYQHLSGYNTGIDTLFYKFPQNSPGRPLPGRMSPQTASCYIFMGLGLLLAQVKKRVVCVIAQLLFHLVTLIAFIVLMGYLFQANDLHKLFFVSSMALHTSVAFFIVSVTATLINPSLGLTGMFTGNGVGNLMARRFFFYMLAAIIITCYLRILAHWHNIISVELSIALVAVAFTLITLALIYFTTKALNTYESTSRTAAENLSVMLDSAPYPIIRTDGYGTITMINRQTEVLFGYTRHELIGNQFSILVPEKLHESYLQNREMMHKMETPHTFGTNENLFAKDKSGREFPVEVSVCPVKMQYDKAMLISILDITTRKDYENTIKSQLNELHYKNQELEQFNYISSHDLQEPLRTVLNYMQLLEEDYPDMDVEVKMHLKSVESAIKRMSTVVRSLLDFGRLGRNKKLECTNIETLINDVVHDLGGLVNKNDAKIKIVCELPDLYTYNTELRQLFQNLISNAIKFRKKDVSPEVEICAKKTDGYYEFSVEDNGIGIESKYHDKIFHIFQRLNKDDEYEGHGIGLANAKKIAEMHGGKLWVESAPGKGSIFRFTILNIKPIEHEPEA